MRPTELCVCSKCDVGSIWGKIWGSVLGRKPGGGGERSIEHRDDGFL